MNEKILSTLKGGPLSGRALAKKLKRRVVDVTAACALLAADGRIRREGLAWHLEPLPPLPRCSGANAQGDRCGREAVRDSDFCTLHQEDSKTEPKWRFPWTIESARDQVCAFASSPGSAGRWADPGVDPPSVPTTIEAAFRIASDEARRFLEWKKDREWLEEFDSIQILRLLLAQRPELFDKFFDEQEAQQ